MKYAKFLLVTALIASSALVSYRAGEAQTALQVCVDAPAAQRNRVLTGYTNAHGYTPTVINGSGVEVPNPETRAQFAKRKLAETVRETVKAWEAGQAAEAARAEAAAKVDAETGIQ
jgi:hypothetical protein